MTDSSITYNEKGDAVVFAGPDAVECFRVACLASAMGLYKVGMRPSRNAMSGPQALKAATRYTGQAYKRGEYDRAKVDLYAWVQVMKSALPSETR
jgi:hypothetical protein